MKRGLHLSVAVLLLAGIVKADDLVQVRQDFSSDPGWDNSMNRVRASNPPTVTQDFGWTPGKIGGAIYKSTTPAWYGMKLNPPVSFKDPFSVTGRISVQPQNQGGVAYLGLFNHQRQGWRPWSSMAIRLVHEGKDLKFFLDFMTSRWNAGAAEMECTVPADGSEHVFNFAYDPNATRAPWTDLKLKSYLTTGRQTLDQLFEKAKAVEPDITREQLEKRLKSALELGLVNWLARHRTEYWLLKQEGEDLLGCVSVQVDGGQVFRTYMNKQIRDTPVTLDRFGIFNFQLYHGFMTFHVWDLRINGQTVDLSKDPGWEGKGNHVTFAEQDFQRQDFGYSPDTNFAGARKGELGGQTYNVEPVDPSHGYYADDIGRITLDDPVHFSGKLSYHEGSTDAGAFFGYFNSADEKRVLQADSATSKSWPQPNTLGIVVDGPARIGWYFTAQVSSQPRYSQSVDGPVILPTREPRSFDFDYDPTANGGNGRITVKLDSETFKLDLKPEQRKAGATFDRFGMMSFRRGGKYEILYFDDLSYTARRPKDYRPVFHEQKITTIRYPRGGRAY